VFGATAGVGTAGAVAEANGKGIAACGLTGAAGVVLGGVVIGFGGAIKGLGGGTVVSTFGADCFGATWGAVTGGAGLATWASVVGSSHR
jgi:hypothetical protein